MKRAFYLLIAISLFFSVSAQDDVKEKKKFGLKVPKLNIGEKLGNLAGNLMTGKADELGLAIAKINYTCGVYPFEIKTSESKYFPEGTVEGDYAVSITFFKSEGMGLVEIEGEVLCEGEPMEYVGLGSYLKTYKNPPVNPIVVSVKTVNGDEASFTLNDMAGVEIISINGETSLPILDLDEDIVLEYNNPPGSEGSRIRVSLITDVMGARALNHFANFPVSKIGDVKVTIPKESLANPEIAGQLNTGQFNKGENWLIVEREKITEKSDYDENQKPGALLASEMAARSYATMSVIVKGKQEAGVLASLRVTGKSKDKILGFEFYKPNATTGIPLSKASKFGLASFTMSASTFREETRETSSSYSMGGTSYTRTTTTTTTYQFPELPKENWDYVMDRIYNDVVSFMKSEYNIDFVSVEEVTGTSQYVTLFPTDDKINSKVVKQSYKGTKRTSPRGFSEIVSSVSSNTTSDNPQVNMMKEAGDLDGLVSMSLNLQVGANKDGNIVLSPEFSLSVSGRDETNSSKLGKYFDGYVVRTTGESFNSELLKSSKEELLRVCSHKTIIEAMKAGITTLREKEIAMGYDKIWNVSE